MINELHEEKQREAMIRSLGVFELRGLAREFGVSSPTTKKREELISLILEKVKEGKVLDLNIQKRGRPFKKLNSLNEIVNNVMQDKNDKGLGFDSVVYFMQEERPMTFSISEEIKVFEGVVKEEKEGFSVVDINKNIKVFIENSFEEYELLEIGMYVKIEGAKICGTEVYLATSIKEINGENVARYKPSTYDKGEEIISNENIPFGHRFAKVGRRNIYCFNEDLYENDDLKNLYNYCIDQQYKLIVLNIDTIYENQIMIRNLGIKNNFTTQYGEKSYWSLHKVADVIDYVQYLVGIGKNVVLFIPDILSTLRKVDDYFEEDEEICGYKQQTKFIIQKLLALGRAYKNNCSATLIMGYNELDKEDKFLNNDIIRISKKI